jgi:hypothetical protein
LETCGTADSEVCATVNRNVILMASRKVNAIGPQANPGMRPADAPGGKKKKKNENHSSQSNSQYNTVSCNVALMVNRGSF